MSSQDTTKNRWFWGQWGLGKGKYAFCKTCNEKAVSTTMKSDGKSYCNRCGTEIEWREKE